MRYVTTIGEREYLVEVREDRRLILDGKEYEIDFDFVMDQPVYSLLIDGRSFEAYVYPVDETWQVLLQGRAYQAKVEDEREKRLRAASGSGVSDRAEFHLRAPMPGLVVSILVEEGQEIHKGDMLLILESMKMQNELKSPRDGKISRLRVKPGESVEQHQTMLSVI